SPASLGRKKIRRSCRRAPPRSACACSTASSPTTTSRIELIGDGDPLLPLAHDDAGARAAADPGEDAGARRPGGGDGGIDRAGRGAERRLVDLQRPRLPAAWLEP